MKFVVLGLYLFFFSTAFSQLSQPIPSHPVAQIFGDYDQSIQSNYDFSESMVIVWQTKSDGKSYEMIYKMRIGLDGKSVCMSPQLVNGMVPQPAADMVLDFNKKRVITLMSSSGTKLAMIYPLDKTYMSPHLVDNSPVSFDVSGKSKEILGYNCIEYKGQSDGMDIRFYATKELHMNQSEIFQSLGFPINSLLVDEDLSTWGFVMEYHANTLDNSETTSMTVQNVNKNDNFILNTDGYVATTLPMVATEE